MQNNEGLVKVLDRISKKYKDEGDVGRKKAYEKAALAIRNHGEPITSGFQARQIKGIGPSIGQKIDEYLQTGQIASILGAENPEDINKRYVIEQFKRIKWVGDAYAEQWYNMGYRTLQDLAHLYPQMTHNQQIAYKYFNDIEQRVPREEIDRANAYFHSLFDPAQIQFTIAGSYRRGAMDSGDIDLLIQNRMNGQDGTLTLESITRPMKTSGFIIESLTDKNPEHKFMAMVRVSPDRPARRMDILLIDPVSWPYALLYFTGSDELNKSMREYVKKFGLTLNEYRLLNTSNPNITYPALTEKDIFDLLGLKYMEPRERNGDRPLTPITAPPITAPPITSQYQENQPQQNQPQQFQQNQMVGQFLRVPSGKWYRSATDLYVYVSSDIFITENVAAFDLDGTLINPKRGQFPKTVDDIVIMPNRVTILQSFIAKGYTIVIFTNQNLNRSKDFKYKRANFVIETLNLPLIFCMSTADDEYRKPKTGMFSELRRMMPAINMQTSFYCGNASGRPGDHSDSDLMFARNIGIRFYVPEEIFG